MHPELARIVAASVLAAVVAAVPGARAAGADAAVQDRSVPAGETGTVEFRINGEAFTRESIAAGTRAAAKAAPDVCPTEEAAAFEMRRTRLIKLVPIRQFLDKEGIAVPEAAIEARIAAMSASPNPFGVSPPKPMNQVMVRQAMPMDDVRLAIRIELGLTSWAERERTKKWPSEGECAAHVAGQRAAFERENVRLSRISFNLSRWPKGAKDEDEALERLKEQAAAARKRIEAGEAFEDVAAEVRGVKKDLLPEPAIVPYSRLAEEAGARLRELPEGRVSEPLRSGMGWDLYRKEPMDEAQMSAALKQECLAGLQADVLRRIAAEARLEKVHWADTSVAP